MIKFNTVEYDYHPGISLRELAEAYYSEFPNMDFEDFIVVVNNSALTSLQAEGKKLNDNDIVYFVPKLDGG